MPIPLFDYRSPVLRFSSSVGAVDEKVRGNVTVVRGSEDSNRVSGYVYVPCEEPLVAKSKYSFTARIRLEGGGPFRFYAFSADGSCRELIYELQQGDACLNRWIDVASTFTPQSGELVHCGFTYDDVCASGNEVAIAHMSLVHEPAGRVTLQKVTKRFKAIESNIEHHKAEREFLYYHSLREDCGSLEDAKLRFFRSLEPDDSGLKTLQDATVLLLEEVARICDEHSIDYWLDYGTLLGAVRHGGVIPWDDDIDICMMRGDIERLREIVALEDTFIAVEQHYVIGHDTCNIVRVVFADAPVKVFVDIFIFDWVNGEPTDDLWRRYRVARGRFSDGMLIYAPRVDPSPGLNYWERRRVTEKSYLTAIEQARVSLSEDLGVSSAPTNTIMWGIDNVSYAKGWKGVFSADLFFPLTRLEFAHHLFSVPAKYEERLRGRYGDYLSLPSDILGHQHVVRNADMVNKAHWVLERYGATSSVFD